MSDLSRDIQGLTSTRPEDQQQATLPAAAPRVAIPARSGLGKSAQGPRAGSQQDGAIASPLTEGTPASPASLQRTYHADKTLTTSDGLFVLRIAPVASISFVDANGKAVVLNLSSPP